MIEKDHTSVPEKMADIKPMKPNRQPIESICSASDSTEQAVYSSSPKERAVFDLRAALRMVGIKADFSSRTGYQLPSLVASLSPPSSPRVRRPTPYTIPSAYEREALRVQRSVPQFKARPLNPKVFTGAGDLGVPRIQKQPLTIPVSPVFSRPRTRDAVSENEIAKDEVSRSTAAARLKAMMRKGPETKTLSRDTSNFSYNNAAKHSISSNNNINGGNSNINSSSSTFLPHAFSTFPSQNTRSEAFSSTAAASWTTPRIPISIAGTAGEPSDLGRISGPPLRSAAPTLPTTSAKGSMAIRESKPVTRPVPFKFATTELQRKRRMFDSVYDMIAAAAATLDESDHVLQ
ncbi:hypothetical protein BGZ67_009617 [Mortierella alpina]|nr:hypothetical protein BGZ67_009617 [Mortierella alpina]